MNFRQTFMAVILLQAWTSAALAFPIEGRPIRIIVPFAAGGSTDVMAREVGKRLGTSLGVTVIIENKPGGNTSIATAEVARSTPDGHTLLYTSMVTHALNPHLQKPRGYDVVRDFTPISGMTKTNIVLLTGPSVNAANLKEFISAARASNGRLSFGSIGVGSAAHLFGAHIAKVAGVELLHVPYRGSAPASTDFLGGQIDALFDPVPQAIPKLASDKVKAIGIAAKARSPLLPNVPTFEEQGLPGIDSEVWVGIFGPGRMPTEVSKRLADEIGAILADANVQEFIAKNGEQPLMVKGEAFAEYVTSNRTKWGEIIKDLGVSIAD